MQYLSFDHNRQFLLEESNPRFLSLAFLQAAAKADPATLNFMLDNACIDLSTVVDDAFWIDLENYAEISMLSSQASSMSRSQRTPSSSSRWHLRC